MTRTSTAICAFLLVTHVAVSLGLSSACAQTTSPITAQSDPKALVLTNQAILALTGGTPIADVTLTATVKRGTGTNQQTGSATLKARGTSQGRVDASTPTPFREIRNDPSGASYWYGADSTWHAMSIHNCWTDAAWFFPALSSLGTSSNPGAVVSYVGQQSLGGIQVNHIRFSRTVTTTAQQPASSNVLIAHLSTVDVYLDANSSLPVAETFNMHPDDDAGKDLPAQVMYSDYRNVKGVMVPFHIQEYLQGSLLLDVTVNSVVFNTGLTDSDFTAQ